MSGFNAILNLIYYSYLNLGIGIFALYFLGVKVTKKMEYFICEKRWNSILTGIIGLLIILVLGIFFGSTVGFIEEGISQINKTGNIGNALFDYYFKPYYWILLFGIIPTLVTGGILGIGIKKTATNTV